MAHDAIFNWGYGKEADWFYDISDDNPGLSVMSSAPFTGTASWKNGTSVETTYFRWTSDSKVRLPLLTQRPMTTS